jgi:hypothetical protein
MSWRILTVYGQADQGDGMLIVRPEVVDTSDRCPVPVLRCRRFEEPQPQIPLDM